MGGQLQMVLHSATKARLAIKRFVYLFFIIFQSFLLIFNSGVIQ